MALKPVDNETFYKEVDEELRREQLSNLWKRYRFIAIAGIVLFLAVLAGVIWWYEHKQQQANERGERLVQIFKDIQAGRKRDVEARLDALAKEGSPGYRAAALLTKADLAIGAGNENAAIAGFKSVAGDQDLPQVYRALALIRQTALEFDKLAPAEVVRRLQPLIQPGSAWLGSAGEMVATAYLKQNQPRLAAPIYAAMAKDKTIPDTLRSRAVQMAGALGVDAVGGAPVSQANSSQTKPGQASVGTTKEQAQ